MCIDITPNAVRRLALDEATKLGEAAAIDAASWSYDGNSDVIERRKVLTMMREGDPRAWDCLPAEPDLSGQWADSPTPASVFYDCVGRESEGDDYDNDLEQELSDAYVEAVQDSFSRACEAELIRFTTTVQTVAQDAHYHFMLSPERRVYVLKDDAPDWLRDAVREAHGSMLPDDYVYHYSLDALSALYENEDTEDARDSMADDVDIYTSDLADWYSSHSARRGYVEQARSEGLIGEDADIDQQLQAGQYIERSQVFAAMLQAVESEVERVTDR